MSRLVAARPRRARGGGPPVALEALSGEGQPRRRPRRTSSSAVFPAAPRHSRRGTSSRTGSSSRRCGGSTRRPGSGRSGRTPPCGATFWAPGRRTRRPCTGVTRSRRPAPSRPSTRRSPVTASRAAHDGCAVARAMARSRSRADGRPREDTGAAWVLDVRGRGRSLERAEGLPTRGSREVRGRCSPSSGTAPCSRRRDGPATSASGTRGPTWSSPLIRADRFADERPAPDQGRESVNAVLELADVTVKRGGSRPCSTASTGWSRRTSAG